MTSPSNVEPSNLDVFIAEITGNGESDYIGVQHQVPFRIQGHLYAQLTSIMGIYDMRAREKGRRSSSRNKVLNDLLAISLDAVLSKLGSEDLAIFEQLYSTASAGALRYVESEEELELLKNETRYENNKRSKAAKESQ
jgi:hypothetical protein